MDKVFISDLHLGDASRADDFRRTEEFLSFLETIDRQDCQLIIVGDLFELWQADLDRILFCHSRVIKRLFMLAKNAKVTYLIGNHDHIPFIKYLDDILRIQLEFRDDENGIWAEHGNQYDIFNRYKDPRLAVSNRLAKAICRMTGWAERLLHPDFDEWTANMLLKEGGPFLRQAARLKNMVTPSSQRYYRRGGNLSEYESAAEGLINDGKRIVIFGHTHKPLLKKLGKGVYANCGCWCGSGIPTYIRVSKENIELRDGIDHGIIEKSQI